MRVIAGLNTYCDACAPAKPSGGEQIYPKDAASCQTDRPDVTMSFAGPQGREGSTSDPVAPPLTLEKAFSRSGSGRNFSLYSRVMRVGLSTDPDGRWPCGGLSGPVFSGPHDCANLVNSLQDTDTELLFIRAAEHFDAGGARRDGTEIERLLVAS